MKITERTVITLRRVGFSRGFLEEYGNETFFRLFINANIGKQGENYNYTNWTKNDLRDLADAIYKFLELANEIVR